MFRLISAVTILSVAYGVLGQVQNTTLCSVNSTAFVSILNTTLFQGVWYQVERISNTVERGDCSTTNYALVNNTVHVLAVSNREVVNRTEYFRNGIISRGNDTTGNFAAVFQGSGGNESYPFYRVLATDHTGYALIYACTELNSTVLAWKLSRSTTLTNAQHQSLNATIQNHPELRDAAWRATPYNNNTCQLGGDSGNASITLCSASTTAVVQNLNTTLFQGVWYQVERISNTVERGDCSTTNYALVNNTVHVLAVSNREVVNRTEYFRNGIISRGNDTTGNFAAVFQGSGGNETYPFYRVLATDHTGYALIYACTGVNSTVLAWKLSRSTTLTNAQHQSLNVTIQNHPELRDAAWRATPYNNNTCQLGGDSGNASITLCSASTTAVVQNLNTTLFQGLWYQIERINNTVERGHCSTTTYAAVNNTDHVLTVSNREVVNKREYYRNGTIIRTNGTTGNFAASFNSSGGIETYSFYRVLATDHTGYALIYACTNINSTVVAWKLSRTANLTNVQLQNLNTTIQNYPELRDATWHTTLYNNDVCDTGGSSVAQASPFLLLLSIFCISKYLN